MSVAVVFDSAGTLLHTYRAVRDVSGGRMMPGVETVTLTFSSPDRVLVVIHVHSRDIIESPPDMLLSNYLTDNMTGTGSAVPGRLSPLMRSARCCTMIRMHAYAICRSASGTYGLYANRRRL